MTKEKRIEPLMKRGTWFTSFLDVLEFGKEKVVRRIFVGHFKTAQEAYAAGLDFVLPPEIKDPPENLVLELLKTGTYPESIEEQFVFPEVVGTYLDCHGVTRGSYLSRRANGE